MNKEEKYKEVLKQIDSVLEGEINFISKMSTISCLLKEAFDFYYWVGFYIEENGVLKVGPYQGTLGCLTIQFNQGVCGRAYRLGTTQIVEDTHHDPEHIACDSNSNSEIVVPVKNSKNEIIAVLDVDSTLYSAFDEVDQYYLELLMKEQFSV
jgi:L-methionine (R)-S-oxide reductase